MHYKKVILLFSMVFMLSLPSITLVVQANEKDVKNTKLEYNTIIQCKVGNSFNILVDGKEVDWTVKDTSKVSISKKNKITIKEEGTVLLISKNYNINLIIKGTEDTKTTINMDYNSETNISLINEVKDVEIVEVNQEVEKKQDELVNIEGISEVSNEKVKIEEEGTYEYDDTELLKAIAPIIKAENIIGSVGEEKKLEIENLEEGVEVEYISSDETIAKSIGLGYFRLLKDGTCSVTVKTGTNELSCDVIVSKPEVDETEMKLGLEDSYQIEVNNNLAKLPITYSLEGDGQVSDSGLVSNIGLNGTATVTIKVGNDFEFKKTFIGLTLNEQKFEDMQPYIQECLGTPYVFGGVTPGVGIDCSAYVSYVYRNVGLMEGRLTAQGLYDISTMIDNPQPGDMIYFTGTYDSGSLVSHIGIVAGDGMMYHSGNPNKLESYETDYWRGCTVGFGTLIR